ncbi:MAG: lipoprotein NlpD [Thiomicrorhabdus sp.]|nr:MAG: lipoprotein NlpD [Thiomicrorhabdus sp.]
MSDRIPIMQSLNYFKFNMNTLKLGVITVSIVLVGCSSPLKYTPRDTNWQENTKQHSDARQIASARKAAQARQSMLAQAKPVVEVQDINEAVVQSQAINVNQYSAADLPSESPPEVEAKTETVTPTKLAKKRTSAKSSAPCSSEYKVKKGDSVSDIAFRCKITPKQLAEYNALVYPYTLSTGQYLLIPKVKSAFKAQATKKPTKQNELTRLMGSEWKLPVDEGQSYRFIRDNAGLSVLEFKGSLGQRVNAVAPGKVVYSGNGIINFGWMVVVKHDDGFMSVYAHNTSVLVKEGDRVKSGQFISTLGASGNATSPKLYLEARFKGRKVDIRKIYNQL